MGVRVPFSDIVSWAVRGELLATAIVSAAGFTFRPQKRDSFAKGIPPKPRKAVKHKARQFHSKCKASGSTSETHPASLPFDPVPNPASP